MAKFKSVIADFKKIKEAVSEQETKKGGGGSFDNPLLFKPKMVQGQEDTEFRIRFLPLEESSTGNPWIKVGYHMFERPGDNKFIKVIDPKTFDPKATNPISIYATKLWKSENPIDKEAAKKLFSKDRYFTLVYVKEAPANQKNYEGKVLIYEIGKKTYDKLSASIKKFEKCFWDPYQGQDFLLVIKETGGEGDKKWPDYSQSDWIGQAGPIVDDEALMESICDQLAKVSIKKEIIEKEGVKSSAELQALLEGGMGELQKPKTVSKPTTDLVSEVRTSAKKQQAPAQHDFGTEKTEPKAVQKVAPAAVVTTAAVEEEVDITDIGAFEFKDDDFK